MLRQFRMTLSQEFWYFKDRTSAEWTFCDVSWVITLRRFTGALDTTLPNWKAMITVRISQSFVFPIKGTNRWSFKNKLLYNPTHLRIANIYKNPSRKYVYPSTFSNAILPSYCLLFIICQLYARIISQSPFIYSQIIDLAMIAPWQNNLFITITITCFSLCGSRWLMHYDKSSVLN